RFPRVISDFMLEPPLSVGCGPGGPVLHMSLAAGFSSCRPTDEPLPGYTRPYRFTAPLGRSEKRCRAGFMPASGVDLHAPARPPPPSAGINPAPQRIGACT